MKNYIQEGDSLVLTAPYARAAGEGALIGTLFGVALTSVASGVRSTFTTRGVFELNKKSAEAWTEGAKIYWDNTARECTTVSTSNTLIGCAVEAAANPSATGIVRLNGTV